MAATTTRVGKPGAALADRLTVGLLTLAAVFVVLAFLAWEMRSAPASRARPVVVMRRVYETRVVETIVGGSHASTSVSGTVSSSAPMSAAALPVTRTS